jgi:hypothetical protein
MSVQGVLFWQLAEQLYEERTTPHVRRNNMHQNNMGVIETLKDFIWFYLEKRSTACDFNTD